jgi:hypothetical protein
MIVIRPVMLSFICGRTGFNFHGELHAPKLLTVDSYVEEACEFQALFEKIGRQLAKKNVG